MEKVKPVRMVIELHPSEHRALRKLSTNYAERLELTSVAMSEVMRTLLDLCLQDKGIAARVEQALKFSGGSQRAGN